MTSSEAESDVCCANCGVAEVDDINLKKCDGCDPVKYCGDKCTEEHREQHGEDCRKRVKELHDNELFTQPDDSCFGECPLCFLPMPFDVTRTVFKSCCSKLICKGCVHANWKSNGNNNCPFCREPPPDEETRKKSFMKRIKANDPVSMRVMSTKCSSEGNYEKGAEYMIKAAELGDAEAHFRLGIMYWMGLDGVEKDEEKKVYHYEKAAIDGHPFARYNLGCIEERNGNIERAAKHFIIAANIGYEKSMKKLWPLYSAGAITKEELDATLRTHQAAINEMKNPEREAAYQWEAERARRKR